MRWLVLVFNSVFMQVPHAADDIHRESMLNQQPLFLTESEQQ